jgi:preprotein translocase subunit SecA
MTGTGKTAEKEFKDIYNLEVIVLPTSKPMIRKDLSDFVYQTEIAKWKAVLNESKKCFQTGQPLLIGTASVEKSEFLSELFKISKIPHNVLNAKPENISRESEIIAQAGERFAITIATNMAGRGTDIILGGNPIFKVKQTLLDIFIEKTKNQNAYQFNEFIIQVTRDYEEFRNFLKLEEDIKNLPYSLDTACSSLKEFYNYLYQIQSSKWKNENNIVKSLGGLFVLGTERHETRRIDNQLRGRAGRQGDPGISQFFVSLEDDLIKVFGGENISGWMKYLIEDKNAPLESNLLTRSIENAQQKIELYNYEIRKNVFQYDNVLNTQRKILFQARREILSKNLYFDLFLRCAEESLDKETNQRNTRSTEYSNYSQFEHLFNNYSTYHSFKTKSKQDLKLNGYEEIWIDHDLRLAESNLYQLGFLKNNHHNNLLSIIDFYWTDHLERMNYIRETVNWRAYGQQNPLIEYNLEAIKSLNLTFEQIRSSMLYCFLDYPVII